MAGGTGAPRIGRGRRFARAISAGLSVLVLGLSWYGWERLHQLTDGLNTADVLGAQAASTAEQNILLVGLDSRTDAQGNPLPQAVLDQLHAGSSSDGGDNTDTIIVIHIPAAGGAATGVSIPRDSYVDIAGGYGKHKINSAYTDGKNTAAARLQARGVSGPQLQREAAAEGARTAIQTVEKLSGLTINHYAAVNLAGFYDISQAIGGVAVCLNNPVHDSYSGADFPAGTVTVQGAQALAFVRQRHGLLYGDLDRVRRQQAFTASMANTILSAGTLTDPTKLDNLATAIKNNVTIDQGWDLLAWAQQLQRISAGNISFTTIPVLSPNLATPEDGDAVEVDPRQVQAFFGTLLSADDAHRANTPSNTSITVDVRNATATAGLAAQTLTRLTAAGFGPGEAATVSRQATSSIHYPPGGQAAAQTLTQALGAIPTQQDDTITDGHLQLYLGANHDAVINNPATTTSSPAQPPPPITAATHSCIN